jgi:DNA topoisomerase-1
MQEIVVAVDPSESAQEAGLIYVSDTKPGITRQRSGRGFRYFAPDGDRIRDKQTLARIKSLVIPPAWTDVWICPNPRGHIQATGRDDRDRKQYRYHPKWREVRDETKYNRMIAFGEALPAIRKRVEHDLSLPELPREKVLATVVRLLETTLIRVGNEEYARSNHSFGLTTMRNRHVKVDGSKLRFKFKGKSGKTHSIGITDRRLARIVKRCQDLPDQELFEYLADDGTRHTVDSSDVNDYLQEISGKDFTAKDFRTWAGTLLAASTLTEMEQPHSQAEAKRNVVQAIEQVSSRLGNTPTICRKCYVHPAVLDAYLEGTLLKSLQKASRKDPPKAFSRLPHEEAAVLIFLSML